jgi:hypothetical protein
MNLTLYGITNHNGLRRSAHACTFTLRCTAAATRVLLVQGLGWENKRVITTLAELICLQGPPQSPEVPDSEMNKDNAA